MYDRPDDRDWDIALSAIKVYPQHLKNVAYIHRIDRDFKRVLEIPFVCGTSFGSSNFSAIHRLNISQTYHQLGYLQLLRSMPTVDAISVSCF